MTTWLVFFFRAFGEGSGAPTLTGQWSYVIQCKSNQPRITTRISNPRVETKAETRV